MSRTVMKTPVGLECDHINRNTLDNRKENLRNITHSLNMLNANSRSSTGQRGVSKVRGKYRARIIVNKKYIHLGLFEKLEDAVLAYKEELSKHISVF